VDHQVLQARSELLRRMNADDFARLQPHLESVFLELRTPLETADRKIEAVYFLESGLASVVAKTSGKEEPEVGIIGFEGMTGTALIMGDDQANFDCYIQSTSEALRIATGPFLAALEGSPTLRPFCCATSNISMFKRATRHRSMPDKAWRSDWRGGY